MKTKQTESNLSCGIDVSQNTLDCWYNLADGKEVYLQVTNDEKGFRQLFKICGNRKYVMESSGIYSLHLAMWLKGKECIVCMENALVIKRFIQMNQERNKNDRKDAHWIYRYSQEQETKEWKVPSVEQQQCKQLLNTIEMYNQQRNGLINQLHSIKENPVQSSEVKKSITLMLKRAEGEIAKLEKTLVLILGKWSPAQFENLQTIPGLGKRAVAILIASTEAFTKIENHRQLISLAGLSPREYRSGTSIRAKTRICKMGGGRLRSILYMCSMSAIRTNRACKNLYERLISKGKNGKLALIAVCNKLLKQAFAIAKSGLQYNENHVSTLA